MKTIRKAVGAGSSPKPYISLVKMDRTAESSIFLKINVVVVSG
jgi:hypothetical protein